MDEKPPESVLVWDPVVRLFHWTLVVAFFIAYFTESDLLLLHVWAGYVVGAIVVLRAIWGLVGPKHARISDFVFWPWTAWRYLIDLIGFRAERYLGHSPAGGAMVVALLVFLAASVWSGLETYAVEENAGPLAARPAATVLAAEASPVLRIQFTNEDEQRSEDRERGDREGSRAGSRFWKEVHEAVSTLTFILVVLHIAGVALASVVHRENLPRAMITGRKRGL